MHTELQEAIDLHESIVAEAGNALVGYETEKALANVVLLSEIPTTYTEDSKRQVNAWLYAGMDEQLELTEIFAFGHAISSA